ncbi:hypothetical protein ABIE44_002365 [Marmoricola sp. OAE513]
MTQFSAPLTWHEGTVSSPPLVTLLLDLGLAAARRITPGAHGRA